MTGGTWRAIVRERTSLTLGLCLLAGTTLLLPACESVPLTAAPGTSLTLIANPTFVVANGGISVLSAILVEPAGTFVPDGTEVFFFTNLGRVDEVGKTRNGVARVNFVSDARSGRALVTAISGGPAPTTPTTTLATGRSGAVAAASREPSLAPEAAAASIAAGENSDTVEIAIGSALPVRVVVTADPAHISAGRPSSLRATVFDANGNPVQNVPVSFSVTGATERLDSGGAFLFTNSNGQVTDTLRTSAGLGSVGTVTVTATTANGVTGTVTVARE
jgi:Bacterial Ig-like domain (group 1)